jgi:hypothetical protein
MLYTDNRCLLSILCYFVDGGQYHRTVENEARHRSLINGDKKQNSYDTSEVIIEQVKLKKSVGLISGTSLIIDTKTQTRSITFIDVLQFSYSQRVFENVHNTYVKTSMKLFFTSTLKRV